MGVGPSKARFSTITYQKMNPNSHSGSGERLEFVRHAAEAADSQYMMTVITLHDVVCM
jgi:hypothetical protein